MSIERVRREFEKLGIANRIIEFDVSSATVELAAAALGCEGKRIAKTLSFMVDGFLMPPSMIKYFTFLIVLQYI